MFRCFHTLVVSSWGGPGRSEGDGGVWAVCTLTVGNKTLLATGGDGDEVRLWDLANRQRLREPEGHDGGVNAVCAVVVEGRAAAGQRR